MSKQKRRDGNQQCYYCDCLLGDMYEEDHFPIPKQCGGKDTVPACISCHNMKDRMLLDRWPAEWWVRIQADFPKMNRETRIFLAKVAKLCIIQSMEAKQAANSGK